MTSLSDFGLTYLMFLAGTELDLSTMRQGHLGRAAGSWVGSLGLALGVGVVSRPRASSSTRRRGALPDHDRARHAAADPARHRCPATPFGPPILSVGSIGEFGPIVLVALLLTNVTPRLTFLLLALFVAVAVVAALLATQVHPPRFSRSCEHLHSTSQLPVRISVLLVILLVYLAESSASTCCSALSRPASSCACSSTARTASRSRASSRRSASAS